MKKIFTLIAMATMAVGVNAQEENPDQWPASSLTFADQEVKGTTKKVLQGLTSSKNTSASYVIPQGTNIFEVGTYPDNTDRVTNWLNEQADKSIYAVALDEYSFSVSTPNVTLKAVSTPNSDKDISDAYQNKAGSGSNEALTTDDCVIKWTNYVKPNTGNPSLGYYDYYDKNNDGDPCHRVSDVIWKVGDTQLPGKGCYYEFTFATAGGMTMGVWLGRPNSVPTIVLEKKDITPIAVEDMSFEGYCQNTTFKYPNNSGESTDPTYQKFNFRNDYTLDFSSQPNRPGIGYLSFPVEAKTYLVFQPSNQMGIYGFYFESTAGIENIKSLAKNTNAPIYNLAGQKVAKDFKGIVIQNGKKFVVK